MSDDSLVVGTLDVQGTLSLQGNISTLGNITAGGTLDVFGLSTLADGFISGGDSSISAGDFAVEGNTTLTGTLAMDTIPGGLNVITNSIGIVSAAYPSNMSLPFAGTTSFNIITTTVADTALLYTVPTGKYAMITACVVYNGSGSSTSPSIFASPDGGTTVYLVIAGTAIAASAAAAQTLNAYTFLPGDTIVFNAGQISQTVTMSVVQFDTGKNIVIVNPRNLGTTQTIFTCPTGIRSVFVGAFPAFNIESGTPRYAQESGGSLTYTLTATISSVSWIVNKIAVATATVVGGQGLGLILSPGDTLSLAVSGAAASSHAWITLYQLPISVFP